MARNSDLQRITPKTVGEYLNQAQETMRVLRWAIRELSTPKTKQHLQFLIIAIVAMTILQTVQPKLIGSLLNGVANHDFPAIVFSLVVFSVVIVLHKVADYFYSVSREWILGLHIGSLDALITERFFEKSLGQHEHDSFRLSPENISKGRERLLNAQGILLFDGIPALMSLFVSYLFLWFLSPVAGAVMTLVIIGNLVWMLYLNRAVFEVCTPLEMGFRRLNHYRIERWKNVERVKTSVKEKKELEEMGQRFDSLIADDRTFWIWFIGHCTFRELIGCFGLVLIMAYGAWLVWTNVWFIGLLYPLFTWSFQVAENIWRVGHIERTLNWNMPAIRSMIEALSIPPSISSPPDAVRLEPNVPLQIVFNRITHHYPLDDSSQSPISVIKDVGFVIDHGRKVALIGPSGAGKTTLMKLLLRFMDPEQGSIFVNGCDLRKIDLSSWMQSVAYIPQHAQILNGTIRYNLTYGLSDEQKSFWTDERLWELMRDLQIDFGERLVDGLETVVGDRGMKLSGGQAQRLMIGAAAIQKPSFMIIDEATSHLDSTTERAVHDGLAKILTTDTSALIIAHRLSTVRDLCDTFIVLRSCGSLTNGDSQIEAIGSSFQELYDSSPTFRQLAIDQGISV